MHFSAAIIASIFAASALAAPSPRLQSRLARRAAGRRGQPLIRIEESVNVVESSNRTNVEYSSNWSGAVIESPPSGTTFDAVSAKFTVPTPTVPSDVSGSTFAASAWVGIDGDTYSTAILQTGVDFTVTDSGDVSFDAWYEWYPDYAYDFDLNISAGDVISLSVSSSTTKKGVAQITNESTGKSVSKSLTSTSALGGQNAEWIVEDFEEGSSLVPFADFGTVTFTDTVASASGTNVGNSGAIEIDIEDDSGTVLTSVSIPSSSEVIVKYT